MGNGIDPAFIRETYQRMSDEELVRVATQDAVGLTEETYEIIKDEIARRNLSPNIQKGVEAQQQKTYTLDEIDQYCELIRNLPCPISGRTDAPLNATYTESVMSVIFITQSERKVIIACPDELDKANNDAITRTALLGWWGIPWGPIRSIRAFIRNTRSKKTNRVEGPNTYLRHFVLARIGQIEAYKNDPDRLMEAIRE
jgi:hypothetical protein